ncbi:MAG: D-arabinose 5-phosphate isomerase [Acidobacteria bacterium]|nr:D-arabinose 5-phosphate isomerase [Acidobacteriota bacterium]
MTDRPPRSHTGVDLGLARQVLQTEADAIVGLIDRLDERFERAVKLLADCQGRVIVTGMGKSGIISRKLAATLASTGTPAFFLHPAEAVHGDLGVVQGDDIVLALSHSGETSEILRLLETIRRVGAKVISLTGAPRSSLAETADITLDCSVTGEACPMNLVPTASTTAALALGDALAMTLLERKGFRREDFVSLHPGGGLGKRLLRVDHLMSSGPALPLVRQEASVAAVLAEMSAKGLGMTCVIDADARIAGVITDGDLRRRLASRGGALEGAASALMTDTPRTIGPDMLAAEALQLMETYRITSLVVVDPDKRPLGVLHLHDLWRTELF